MPKKRPGPLLPGDVVRVRTPGEIALTLDQRGTQDNLPFMAEMARYCGRTFTVSKRIERACEESKGMRRIVNVVFLEDLRCDGSAHGGCQKGCKLFWKESWIERVGPESVPPPGDAAGSLSVEHAQSEMAPGVFICQATELIPATSPLSLLDPTSYVRDIRSKSYSYSLLFRASFYALFLRLRYYVTGTPFRFLQGNQTKTPTESLNLQEGEWVTVKTKREIRDTLDKNGENRGLRFTLDMVPYCGGTYRVLKRVDKMIFEPTRELITLKDTVILENSICHGCHILKGGCPRENFNFWREVWLRRASPPRS